MEREVEAEVGKEEDNLGREEGIHLGLDGRRD